VAAESNRISVFNPGTSQGLKAVISAGGHIQPISILGDRLE
jgi:hypothetical protein